MKTKNQTLIAIIMRGLPGSGKSYWVRRYLESLSIEAAIAAKQHGYFSTDSYFESNGKYRFVGAKLAEYHQLNLTAFIVALSQNQPIVICDNTNMAHWEFAAYKAAAKSHGYQVREMLIGDPKDELHQQLCAQRNQHGVPLTQIQKMAQSFED